MTDTERREFIMAVYCATWMKLFARRYRFRRLEQPVRGEIAPYVLERKIAQPPRETK